MTDSNKHLGTLKDLTTNSYNTAGDFTKTSHYDEANIPMIADVVGASENDQ